MSIEYGRMSTISSIRRTLRSAIFVVFISLLVAALTMLIAVHYCWPNFYKISIAMLKQHCTVQGLLRDFPAAGYRVKVGLWKTFNYFASSYGLTKIVSATAIAYLGTATIQIIIFRRQFKKLFETSFVRGSRLLAPTEFGPAVQAESLRHRKEFEKDTGIRLKKNDYWGARLAFDAGGMALPQYFLMRSMMVLGVPGTGKSTILGYALDRARRAREKCLVLDPNGEFYAKFGRSGDKILSLYDKRTERWEAHKEAFRGKKFNFAKYAEFLVAEGQGDKIWWAGAREVLKFLFNNTNDIEELKNYILNLDKGALGHLEDLARGIAGAPDSRQEAGVAAGALLELSFLFDLNYWPREQGKTHAFSVYDWAQNESRDWVFIIYADDDKNVTAPLLRIWTNLAIFGTLARGESPSNIPVNVFVDEMGDVGALDMLASALRRFRKYRGHLYLGLQSLSQFYVLFAKDIANDMIALIGTKVFLRVTNPSEAKVIAEHIGQAEIDEVKTSEKFANKQQDVSVSRDKREKFLAHPDEIRNLPDGHFYLKALNLDPVKSRMKYKVWELKNLLHRHFHSYPPVSQSKKFREYVLSLSSEVVQAKAVKPETTSPHIHGNESVDVRKKESSFDSLLL